MSQVRTIRFDDSNLNGWCGEVWPDLPLLQPLFESLVTLPDVPQPLEPETWRAVLREPIRFIRVLGPRTAHLNVKGCKVPDLAVKVVLPRESSGLLRIAQQVRMSRSRRAYRWAHRLRALGLEAPRPLGYLECDQHPALERSFFISEYIFAPTLLELRDDRVREALKQNYDAVLEKRALIDRLAVLLRELHRHGAFHGDLHGNNLLVGPEGLVLVDLESIRPLSLGRSAELKALVRLNRDFLDRRVITTSDRMRFLRTYLKHVPEARLRRRELFTKVMQRTQQKLTERGEHFQPAMSEAC